ncbi:alpha-protein kinase 3-like isoform X1 [Acipenser ruthenus]|uniref:alpha-protein kinase 3-like isoform X1 n=1 Tax=Acipenser ruthenus TaxID=7906 RepID=UPI002740E8B2|nr:alpha-protein kinase 3-like isoform X1 [Acipenser ruthenus]
MQGKMGSRRSITRAYSANGRYSSNNSSTENGEETPQPSSRPDSRNYLLNVRPENSYSRHRYSYYKPMRSTFCSVIAQLTEETQPTFETTVKSKAVSEDCNVKFSCVVSGYPEPELTWYKDDMEMDRYCGLPKYEIFRNGKTHSLHIYNCTEDDAAIYQVSARNSKGIVSCSGVLEVGTMSEFKIHQRWFAKLKQKAQKKKKELEETRKKGRENLQIKDQLRMVSPERSPRKRRSTAEGTIQSPISLPEREDMVKVHIQDAEARLREGTADGKEQAASAAEMPNGFSTSPNETGSAEKSPMENGNQFLTYIYETVEIITTRPPNKEFLAKKKIKVSNGVDGGELSDDVGQGRVDHENENDGDMSLSQYLSQSHNSKTSEDPLKSSASEDFMEIDTSYANSAVEPEGAKQQWPATQLHNNSEARQDAGSMELKEPEPPNPPPPTSPVYFSLRDIFFANQDQTEDQLLEVPEKTEPENIKAEEEKPKVPQLSIPSVALGCDQKPDEKKEYKLSDMDSSLIEADDKPPIVDMHSDPQSLGELEIPESPVQVQESSVAKENLSMNSSSKQAVTMSEMQGVEMPCGKEVLMSYPIEEPETSQPSIEEVSESKQKEPVQDQPALAMLSEFTDEQRETHLKETCITEDVVNTSQLNVNVPSFISTEETTACVKEFMTESSVLNTHGDQRSNSVGQTEQNMETETQKGIPESIANVDAASECAKPTGNLDNSHALARMDLQQNDVKDYMAEVLDAVKESEICALDKQGVAIPLVEETAVRIEIDVIPEDIVHEKESEVKDLHREFKTLPQEPIVPLELKIPDIAIREVEQESVPKAANLQELELPGESVLERDVKGVPEVPVIVASDEVALKHSDSHTRVEAVREDSILVPQAEVDKKEQEASVQNMRSQENDQTMDNVSGLQIDISNEADIFPSAGVSCDASKSLPKPDSSAQNFSPPNNTPSATQPPPAVPSVLVPAVVVPPISITCFDDASQEDKHAKREVISVPTAVEAVVEQDESLITLLRHVKNDLDAGIRYSIKKESDSKAAPLPIVASTDTDAALLSTSEQPESKAVLTALGTPNRVSSTTISVPSKPEEQTTQGVGLSDKPSMKKVLLGSMASPIQSPSTLRRFATKSPSNAEEPGLATVPTIRVDSLLLEDAAHYEKADEQPEKKDSLLTVQSGESSPKLRHSDSLTLIPSATPEELASGARRKIFIPKPKTEELEAVVPDPQLKKEEVSKRRRLSQDLEVPSVSPGQSRRGLAFLQTPSPQNTPPMERRSPTVSRRTSNLEVPKLYEESVDKSETSKEVEDVKKKQDPFKAPQVIRKIRAEQFSDASGHLKLWCQFFNVLSDSTITWYKDEYQIAELKRSSGDEGQVALAIVQTTKKDCGVYKCEINNEYGTDATDCLLSEEVLSGFLLREESEVGEEIEMTTMVFTKGLADSGSSGDKFFGRIMTEEVHIEEGCTKKACKVKVIYGLDPIFESGSTCIIKVRNFIAYGTKNGSDLIERNHEITKQECKIQNTAREYCKIFAAEARVVANFGPAPEIIPLHLIYRPANPIPYATVEEDLKGCFVRFCFKDRSGRLIMRNVTDTEQKCCAFQHWIYQWTNGNLLVTDMEGVGVKITNIGIATKSKGYQGLTDNCSPVLLEQFITLHQCNRYCGLLSLRPLKTTDTLQQPGKLKGSRSPLLNRKVGSGPSSPQMLKKGSASPQGTRKGTSSPKVVKKSDSGDSKTTTKHKAVEIPKSVKMR